MQPPHIPYSSGPSKINTVNYKKPRQVLAEVSGSRMADGLNAPLIWISRLKLQRVSVRAKPCTQQVKPPRVWAVVAASAGTDSCGNTTWPWPGWHNRGWRQPAVGVDVSATGPGAKMRLRCQARRRWQLSRGKGAPLLSRGACMRTRGGQYTAAVVVMCGSEQDPLQQQRRSRQHLATKIASVNQADVLTLQVG